jgi:hypothetical protein
MDEISDGPTLYSSDVCSLGLPVMALFYLPAGRLRRRWWQRLWTWLVRGALWKVW